MKRILVLLVLLLMFVSCHNDTVVAVTMTEMNGKTEPIQVSVTIRGTTAAELLFTVDGVPYTVAESHIPTMKEPVFLLETDSDDGRAQVIFLLKPDEYHRGAALFIESDDGEELTYESHLDEWKIFTNWLKHN